MRMIDVLCKLANGEIEDQTILKIYDLENYTYTYMFDEYFKAFYDAHDDELTSHFEMNTRFLNYRAELIPTRT